jgi:hypothetical protein
VLLLQHKNCYNLKRNEKCILFEISSEHYDTWHTYIGKDASVLNEIPPYEGGSYA